MICKKLTGVVLAGGLSSRMGTDKALLCYHKMSQLDYVADVLRYFCTEVVVAGRQRQGYSYTFLPNDHTLAYGGPMNGLITAMRYAQGPVLLVGVDYPFLDRDAIQYLMKERDTSVLASVFYQAHDEVYESVIGIYEPAILSHLLSAMDNAVYGLQAILKQVPAKKIIPLNPRWIYSVDTPEEYRRVQKITEDESRHT